MKQTQEEKGEEVKGGFRKEGKEERSRFIEQYEIINIIRAIRVLEGKRE